MNKMKRRTMIKSLGAISAGIASPSVLHADVLVKPGEITEQELEADILVIGGGTAGAAAVLAVRMGVSPENLPFEPLVKLIREHGGIVPE